MTETLTWMIGPHKRPTVVRGGVPSVVYMTTGKTLTIEINPDSPFRLRYDPVDGYLMEVGEVLE